MRISKWKSGFSVFYMRGVFIFMWLLLLYFFKHKCSNNCSFEQFWKYMIIHGDEYVLELEEIDNVEVLVKTYVLAKRGKYCLGIIAS